MDKDDFDFKLTQHLCNLKYLWIDDRDPLKHKAISSLAMIIYQIVDKLHELQEEKMDKKMAKVTKQMKTAEHDISAGKPKAAVKALKSAEKKNVKLTKIDRDVRDPIVEKYEKEHGKKKGK